MRVKRTGAVAMADTLSSHLIISTQFCQRWFLVVKRPQFDSVLRGTTLRDSQLCFAFLILLERCADVYARAGKCSLLKRFLGSLPIATENIVRF